MSLAQLLETVEACDTVICISGHQLYHWSPNDIEDLLSVQDPILSSSISTFHASDAYQITVVLK